MFMPTKSRSLAVAAVVALLAVACGSAATPDETASTANAAPIATVTVEPATSAPPNPPEPTTAPSNPQEATTAPSASATPGAADEAGASGSLTDSPVDSGFIPPTGIVPVRIEIATIGVDAPTIDLSLSGLEPEVPDDFGDTGWYTQTRLPGEIGPAIIAGHIDSRSGPAVFAELDQLVAGDQITVYDAAGDARTFAVVDAAQYPKGDLPDSVFGFGEPEPELRLITCGGTFDAASGHYRDNYVVFARLLEA